MIRSITQYMLMLNVVVLILKVPDVLGHALTSIPEDKTFCWKDSYGRGVGKIPKGCPAGHVLEAGLCYKRCKDGYSSDGATMCYSGCPHGYSSSGCCSCHINKPLTRSVEWRCTHYFPKSLGGKCRWKDSYCPTGYTNAGLFCALTSAGKPPPAGFKGTFLDPMKNSYNRGVGKVPTGCNNGKEIDVGLCYPKCKDGYNGIGPVCWGNPPSGWVQCGMGAASTSFQCASTVFDQVSSVGNMAFSLATLGSGGAASAAKDAGKLADLKAKFKTMMDAAKASKTIQDGIEAWKATETARDLYKVYQATEIAANLYTAEEIVRMAAIIASIADPTGIAGVVAAYTYPKCSALVAIGH